MKMPQLPGLERISKIAVIGNYLPRQCGIATFTSDLCNSLARVLESQDAPREVIALAMDDVEGGYAYPDRVKFQIREDVLADYQAAADFLHVNKVDFVLLQHEYGIFGGIEGRHIMRLLRNLRVPIFTTLHTVLAEPTPEQEAIMVELDRHSEQLVVMSHKAEDLLSNVYGIPKHKIAYIPHGIPNVAFEDPCFHKDTFGIEDRKVILSFGLMGPGKGYEHMLKAMPMIKEAHPDSLYIIQGATHPHVLKQTGDAYRRRLQELVEKQGIQDQVRFVNKFCDIDELCQYIGAADVYVTPYLSEAQIVSGTLAYTVGAGKAVVSTPYWHAVELLAEDRGRLVPFGDSNKMAEHVIELFSNDQLRNSIRKRAYLYGRPMVWQRVAANYLKYGLEAIDKRKHQPAAHPTTQQDPGEAKGLELPKLNLVHLYNMTDSTGLYQHAVYSIPDRFHGYCIDDNARGLIAVCLYHNLSQDNSVIPLIYTYLSFLYYGFNPDTRRFRNFMSFDRRWLEDEGSEDSHGRTLWALGAAVKYAPNPSIRDMATCMFLNGLEVVEQFSYARTISFALVGMHLYMEIYGGDATTRRLRGVLARKLHQFFLDNATDDWQWFEQTVTYDNGKIPQALLLSGQWIPDREMFETGLRSLQWLLDVQTGSEGQLSVIGNAEWLRRGKDKSLFDQQPLEAMSLAQACAEAYRSTGAGKWLKEVRRCLDWYLGRNDIQTPLYDSQTGGCSDALTPHGVNVHQGAESLLAWLISFLTLLDLTGQGIAVKGPSQFPLSSGIPTSSPFPVPTSPLPRSEPDASVSETSDTENTED